MNFRLWSFVPSSHDFHVPFGPGPCSGPGCGNCTTQSSSAIHQPPNDLSDTTLLAVIDELERMGCRSTPHEHHGRVAAADSRRPDLTRASLSNRVNHLGLRHPLERNPCAVDRADGREDHLGPEYLCELMPDANSVKKKRLPLPRF